MMSKRGSVLLTLTLFSLVVIAALSFAIVGTAQKQTQEKPSQEKRLTQTKETQMAMTPSQALDMLREGNKRFIEGRMINRDLRAQIKETSAGQYPFATILSCQDSRTSNDLLFDLNKGDAFSLRIAGNVVNEDILGGMEFGSKAAGANLIAVIGHTKCGAIQGACDNVKLGNLTGLLDRIKPSIDDVPMSIMPRNSKNAQFVDAVTEANVRYQMRQVREKSPILKEMIEKGEIALVGGVYDISTGEVKFFDK